MFEKTIIQVIYSAKSAISFPVINLATLTFLMCFYIPF